MTYPQKITFGGMREMGVSDALVVGQRAHQFQDVPDGAARPRPLGTIGSQRRLGVVGGGQAHHIGRQAP